MARFSLLKRALLTIAASLGAAGNLSADELTVGGKDFTEQYILAEMTRQLLAAEGYDVEKSDGMGSNLVRAALENGAIDLYWEYTGTSLVAFNDVTEILTPDEAYKRVKALDGEKGLVWLAPSAANNTYALAIRQDNPKTDGMKTLSDLAAAYRAGEPVVMATTAEFVKREDGLIGLQKTYEFEAGRRNVKPMEIGLVYTALSNGNVDVAVVGATDGRIAAMNLTLLKDDKSFFPNYALAPVVRQDTLEKHPELEAILESLSTRLDDATMQRLNGEVDLHRTSIDDVAASYLKEQGLL